MIQHSVQAQHRLALRRSPGANTQAHAAHLDKAFLHWYYGDSRLSQLGKVTAHLAGHVASGPAKGRRQDDRPPGLGWYGSRRLAHSWGGRSVGSALHSLELGSDIFG